ncbi:MAG: DUF4332 domain-containing protein [Planctomycetaceae bacterium]
MDALRYLTLPQSEAWMRLFLKHADQYLEGSKAPDKRFRDFRNHVLHVDENFWGGAVKTATRWYDTTVEALRNQNWKEAVYSAGVLSHYYTDPIMPFHTGQSEEETQIHRAVEWSISKSYDYLFELFEGEFQQQVRIPHTRSQQGMLVEELVLAGASLSHQHYMNTIKHYNIDIGVQDPPAGLDALLRETYAKLLGYAALGFARILEEVIQDAGIKPPEVSLTIESILGGLEIPIKWVTRKIADREERLQIEAIYQEFMETGRVLQQLPEDDRLIRQLHAEEVLGTTLSQLNQQPLERLGTEYGQGGEVEKTSFLHRPQRDLQAAYERSRNNRLGTVTQIEVMGPARIPQSTAPVPVKEQQPAPAIQRPVAPTISMAVVSEAKPKIRVKTTSIHPTRPVSLHHIERDQPVGQKSQVQLKQPQDLPLDPETGHPARPTVTSESKPVSHPLSNKSQPAEKLKYYLHRSSDLVDAPSIGPKTAKRFRKIGIKTVDDFLNADPVDMATQLDLRYITVEELKNWQDQTELVCRIPNLRGHDAQILVYSGIRKVEHLEGWEPRPLLDLVQPFVDSAEGVRLLRGSGQPDLQEVSDWLRWSTSARALRAA